MLDRAAVFNKERSHRFLLTRNWDSKIVHLHKRLVNFVMLNPSTADENIDDQTISRCIALAKHWGFQGLQITNLFSLRTPYPKVLYAAKEPNLEANNFYIRNCAKDSDTVVAAWGNVKGAGLFRSFEVLNLLHQSHDSIYCLGKNKTGDPKHPLFIPVQTELQLYRGFSIIGKEEE